MEKGKCLDLNLIFIVFINFLGKIDLLSEKVAVAGVFRAGSLVFGVLKSKFTFFKKKKKEGKRCAFIV